MLNEYQLRLLCHMIKFIELYRNNVLRYSNLVNGMESVLDLGDFQDDFVKQWYDYWLPLEILNATQGDNVTLKEVDAYLSDMESFLKTFFQSEEELHNCLKELEL
ncbi:hypothetical protein JCM16496A_31410 [Bacteroides rodentium JCM 16496]